MTQIERFSKDLTKMSGGHEPHNVAVYHDGFSATFAEEIAALRVGVKYARATVNFLDTVNEWSLQVRSA